MPYPNLVFPTLVSAGVASFHVVGAGDQTQAFRLGGQASSLNL